MVIHNTQQTKLGVQNIPIVNTAYVYTPLKKLGVIVRFQESTPSRL